MNGTLENVVCTASICGDLVSDFCTAVGDPLVHLANWSPKLHNETYIKDDN